MAAESLTPGGVIDQRLDALDRALLGLLPRGERLALVADVEARAREACEGNPAALAELAEPVEHSLAADAQAVRRPRLGRRSRLALTAGVVGIVALGLLLFLPITYTVALTIADGIGEVATMILLMGNIVLVAVGGTLAVLLGLTALVRLSRRRSNQRGHGWAITGLCTGPLPMLAGGLAMLTFGLPLMGELTGFVQATPAYYVSGEGVPCSTGACPPSQWQEQPSLVAAAPNLYPSPGPGPATAPGGYSPSSENSTPTLLPPSLPPTETPAPATAPPSPPTPSATTSPVASLPPAPPAPVNELPATK